MARTGGILTFCMIAAIVIGLLLSIVARNAPVLGFVTLLLYLAAFVMWFVVMIALKVNCDQNNYHRVGGLVWSIIGLTVAIIVVAIVSAIVVWSQFRGTASPDRLDPAAVLQAFGIWGIIFGIISLALTISFLMLGVRLNEYGSMAGGAWKGAGIVLIIATAIGLFNWVLYLIIMVTHIGALGIVAVILAVISAILWLVVWILIGIGFMGDANRMAAAR